MNRFSARSFKFKLVMYFGLLSLLPAAAAFWGFTSVAKQSEVRRVDARLQSGLRAAVTAYGEDLERATRGPRALANTPALQRAIASGDAGAAQELLGRRATFGSSRRTSRSATARRLPPSAACASSGRTICSVT